VKVVGEDEGFRAALRECSAGEAALWNSGKVADLPAPLAWPVLDAHRREDERWWLLMRDVSEGILPRGGFDEAKLHQLLRGIARLHGSYWGDEARLSTVPLMPPSAATRLFAEPASVVARKMKPPAEWLKWMIESFVVGRYVPLFLDALDARDAELYTSFVTHREPWLAALERHIPTFLHGDLRRANISYMPDGTVFLLDWERAMRGHAAIDLTWYWFLQFWAYPPSVACDPDGYRRAYLAYLDEALGRPVDRKPFDIAWGLAWINVLAEIGYLLADRLSEPDHTAEDVARVRDTGRRAIQLAREALERV
jgi:hypothetical protein